MVTVVLEPYSPQWPINFASEEQRIRHALAGLDIDVHHTGSTSVPGLRAKPIVDIAAPVHSLAEARQAVPVLEHDSWLFWADDPNRAYRLWFLRPTPAARTHHLQIMQHDHPELHNLLLFRDALRADPLLRDAYGALKERLAAVHRLDRNAYTDAKSGFVREVLLVAGSARSIRRRVT